MFNAFGKLWLKGAKRLAKAQVAQQKKLTKKISKKVVKALVAAPAKKPHAAKQRAKVGRSSTRTAGTRTAGTWTRSIQASAPGVTPVRRLSYWLYLPPPALAADTVPAMSVEPMPLVIMLHGCEQTAPEFAAGTRMNELAARHGFAVLYPQQSLNAHPQRCWPWYKRSVQHGGDEVILIAGMVEKIIARHAVDRSRVYVAGLSAGAALAQTLALRHPHLIAAVASHSGPAFGLADSRMQAFAVMQHGGYQIVPPIQALLADSPGFPGMPVLILQGQQDPVVRPVNAAQLVRQFCAVNAMPETAHAAPVNRAARGACDAYRVTDYKRGSKTMVRLCEVANLAHAWSGGDPAQRYNTASGPDASKLAWDFFKRHRRAT